ncbi:anti-sigma B factor antagonist [Gammaproteobacteria bacterium]
MIEEERNRRGSPNAIECTKIAVNGEMTIFTAQKLATQLLTSLTDGSCLEVDLSGVSEIDSAGLQLMLAAKRMADARDLSLRFVGHSPTVLNVLDLCDLVSFFGDPVVIQKKMST